MFGMHKHTNHLFFGDRSMWHFLYSVLLSETFLTSTHTFFFTGSASANQVARLLVANSHAGPTNRSRNVRNQSGRLAMSAFFHQIRLLDDKEYLNHVQIFSQFKS